MLLDWLRTHAGPLVARAPLGSIWKRHPLSGGGDFLGERSGRHRAGRDHGAALPPRQPLRPSDNGRLPRRRSGRMPRASRRRRLCPEWLSLSAPGWRHHGGEGRADGRWHSLLRIGAVSLDRSARVGCNGARRLRHSPGIFEAPAGVPRPAMDCAMPEYLATVRCPDGRKVTENVRE
jgi:hypothetical protein